MQIGFSKKVSENLFDDILNEIVENLIKYKKLKISNFSTFVIKNKKSRPGYNLKQKKNIIKERNVVYLNLRRNLKVH